MSLSDAEMKARYLALPPGLPPAAHDDSYAVVSHGSRWAATVEGRLLGVRDGYRNAWGLAEGHRIGRRVFHVSDVAAERDRIKGSPR